MSNSYNISVAPQVAAVQAAVNTAGAITLDIHDVDIPAVKTDTGNIRNIDVSAIQSNIDEVPEPLGYYMLSDDLIHSNDDVVNEPGAAYVKKKEIVCYFNDTIRIKFDLATTAGGNNVGGRIYKNDVAFGTEQSTLSTDYVTFSEDLAFVAGDLIQLYIKQMGACECNARNLRIYGINMLSFVNKM